MSETSDCCKEFEQEQKLTWSLRRIGNQHRLVLMRIQAKHADVVQQREIADAKRDPAKHA